MNIVAFFVGGREGVNSCWQPRCLFVFGMIGGVYQVLLQTKLLITALMCWWLKGSRQSSIQWHVLFAMFLAMSCFVLVDQGSDGSSGSGSLPLLGVVCVMLKVAVSRYCA